MKAVFLTNVPSVRLLDNGERFLVHISHDEQDAHQIAPIIPTQNCNIPHLGAFRAPSGRVWLTNDAERFYHLSHKNAERFFLVSAKAKCITNSTFKVFPTDDPELFIVVACGHKGTLVLFMPDKTQDLFLIKWDNKEVVAKTLTATAYDAAASSSEDFPAIFWNGKEYSFEEKDIKSIS